MRGVFSRYFQILFLVTILRHTMLAQKKSHCIHAVAFIIVVLFFLLLLTQV